MDLPIRIAGYVPTWITLPRALERISVVAIYPQPDGQTKTGTSGYPHRCIVGMAEQSGAAVACEQFLESSRQDLARGVHQWLPELGAKWEHLYLSLVDYANRRRVSPKARQLMEAACGRRMSST